MKKWIPVKTARELLFFYILIHITRNGKETHAVYQIGLVPVAPSQVQY